MEPRPRLNVDASRVALSDKITIALTRRCGGPADNKLSGEPSSDSTVACASSFPKRSMGSLSCQARPVSFAEDDRLPVRPQFFKLPLVSGTSGKVQSTLSQRFKETSGSSDERPTCQANGSPLPGRKQLAKDIPGAPCPDTVPLSPVKRSEKSPLLINGRSIDVCSARFPTAAGSAYSQHYSGRSVP